MEVTGVCDQCSQIRQGSPQGSHLVYLVRLGCEWYVQLELVRWVIQLVDSVYVHLYVHGYVHLYVQECVHLVVQ